MDLHLLGEDHAPAALGLHPAHLGGSRRVAVAATIAMRHLVEAVLGGDGPDPDRLEQDVVARVTQARAAGGC